MKGVHVKLKCEVCKRMVFPSTMFDDQRLCMLCLDNEAHRLLRRGTALENLLHSVAEGRVRPFEVDALLKVLRLKKAKAGAGEEARA
jgi:hypothetical protein